MLVTGEKSPVTFISGLSPVDLLMSLAFQRAHDLSLELENVHISSMRVAEQP